VQLYVYITLAFNMIFDRACSLQNSWQWNHIRMAHRYGFYLLHHFILK